MDEKSPKESILVEEGIIDDYPAESVKMEEPNLEDKAVFSEI